VSSYGHSAEDGGSTIASSLPSIDVGRHGSRCTTMTDELEGQLHRELRAHANAVRGLARDLLRDSHAAEDVAQQTLSKAWAVREQLQPGPMGGWLSRTGTNFSRQWRRGERRRQDHESRRVREALEQRQPSPAE